MRKTIALSFAIALVLGMAQCKKVETIDPDGGEKIQITLDVDGGKHVINPSSSGAVNYASGDVIYVGDGSKFIGTLTHNGTKFVGEVSTPSGEYLHFYFAGGLTPSATLTQGSTTSFTVNISDQSSKLPVLSYGNVDYVPGKRNYTCMLKNKCGLVKFSTNVKSGTVSVEGMNTVATVDFATTPGITSEGTTGAVSIATNGEGIGWAILLEQSEVDDATVTASGYYNGTCDVPGITNNMYYTTGVDITLAVDYVFSVSSTQKVHFSPGNLQYKSDEGWRFAERQYDYIGAWNTSGWVDLFGWGTWGNGKNPLNVSEDWEDYEWSTDFQGTLDGHNDWFTLSYDQWNYILWNNKYGLATVNGVYGVVILPDNSTLLISEDNDSWDNNVYTASEWTDNMEAYGAVFLPAAGVREGSVVYCGEFDDALGIYWSSTPIYEEVCYAGSLYIDNSYSMALDPYYDLYYGHSVRLVR